MNDFISIQDAKGTSHVIFTRYITNLTIQSSSVKIHINSGGTSMTVHTLYTMQEMLDLIMKP